MAVAIVNGYTDLATLKARLNVTDTVEDDQFSMIINAASRAIDVRCQRHFYTVTETRYYQADDPPMPINPFSERRLSGLVKMPIDDVLSVTTLLTDYDGDRVYETTWDPTRDYFLEPANAPSFLKPYTQVRVDWIIGRYRLPPWPRSVAITGVWGYWTSVPEPITECALRLSERLYKLKDAPLGVLPNAYFDRLGEAASMRLRRDPDLDDMIAPYMRQWVVI